ncbi:hypothetical protein D3874_14895 [Oleomonas cavernae]|uniref:Antifreeze protein n=1 Tax=Oleomonas cavernae TaxID=2320859 RepID=A0A418WDP3_9PROT|nr:hypothetical protein [Oleomonas cavernae]RJF88145.1 hypothetical protein D3874_14895 [Oleomonas cavernae]
MTGSRSRGHPLRRLLATTAVALLPFAAQAQSPPAAGPLSLLPPVLDPASPAGQPPVPIPDVPMPIAGGPIELTPPGMIDPTPSISRPGGQPGALGTPLYGTDPRGAALPGAIEMVPLDPPAVAAMTEPLPLPVVPGGEVFGRTLWLNADKALVEQLVPRLPAPARSTVARDLTRRLLTVEMPFSSVRAESVQRLAKAGEAEALGALAQAGLAKLPIDALSAVVDGLAALSDRQRLCTAGLDRLDGEAGRQVDVLRAVALCRATNGDSAGAQIALELARERGNVPEGFGQLIAGLTGGQRPPAAVVDAADTLSLWAAEAQGIALTADGYKAMAPLNLALLARATGPLEDRLAAAERGEAVGIVPAFTLAELYSTGPTPTGAVAGLAPSLRRASLHRAVVEASGPAVRAQAVATLIEAGAGEELSGTLARVEAQAITDVAGQSLPPPIGAALARAALWAGDEAAALAQIMRLGQAAGGRPAKAVTLLWLHQAILSGSGGKPPPGGVDGFIEATSGGAAGARRLAIAAALLDGLNLPVPAKLADAGRAGYDGSAKVPEGVSRQLEDMILSSRRGEAIAIVLVILGDRPLSAVGPAELNVAVTSLRRVGLDGEATALAIEAALAAGL